MHEWEKNLPCDLSFDVQIPIVVNSNFLFLFSHTHTHFEFYSLIFFKLIYNIVIIYYQNHFRKFVYVQLFQSVQKKVSFFLFTTSTYYYSFVQNPKKKKALRKPCEKEEELPLVSSNNPLFSPHILLPLLPTFYKNLS